MLCPPGVALLFGLPETALFIRSWRLVFLTGSTILSSAMPVAADRPDCSLSSPVVVVVVVVVVMEEEEGDRPCWEDNDDGGTSPTKGSSLLIITTAEDAIGLLLLVDMILS